jgi:hypothetical protein
VKQSSGRENGWGRGGGRGGSRGNIDGEYEAWDPHVVVGVEYELRLTGAEKLELDWKF